MAILAYPDEEVERLQLVLEHLPFLQTNLMSIVNKSAFPGLFREVSSQLTPIKKSVTSSTIRSLSI